MPNIRRPKINKQKRKKNPKQIYSNHSLLPGYISSAPKKLPALYVNRLHFGCVCSSTFIYLFLIWRLFITADFLIWVPVDTPSARTKAPTKTGSYMLQHATIKCRLEICTRSGWEVLQLKSVQLQLCNFHSYRFSYCLKTVKSPPTLLKAASNETMNIKLVAHWTKLLTNLKSWISIPNCL